MQCRLHQIFHDVLCLPAGNVTRYLIHQGCRPSEVHQLRCIASKRKPFPSPEKGASGMKDEVGAFHNIVERAWCEEICFVEG